MSSRSAQRAELLSQLERALRETSAYSVLFSHAVAERLGVNQTDLEAMDLLNLHGPVTAGRLADLTGLTTGAVTGLVDRLERAGWVRREPDPGDRRRVIVRPLPPPQMAAVEALYGPMSRLVEELVARYSDQELAVIVDFTRRAAAATMERLGQMREEAASGKGRKRLGTGG